MPLRSIWPHYVDWTFLVILDIMMKRSTDVGLNCQIGGIGITKKTAKYNASF